MRINKSKARAIMAEKNITAEDIANKTGLGVKSIEWILDNADVMADQLERIAEALDISTQEVSACDLLGEDSQGGCSENVIEFFKGCDRAGITLSQPRYVNRVKKLAERYPDEVVILAENKDGSIYARMPVSWIVKPGKPAEMDLTDEQREQRREQLLRNISGT